MKLCFHISLALIKLVPSELLLHVLQFDLHAAEPQRVQDLSPPPAASQGTKLYL